MGMNPGRVHQKMFPVQCIGHKRGEQEPVPSFMVPIFPAEFAKDQRYTE